MNTLRVPEDMPIEQKSLSKIIESAQKKVEGFHFDTRKHLLEYDDVLNRHREVIYGNRKKILESFAREKNPVAETTTPEATPETLQDMIFKMIEEEIEQIVSYHTNVEDATGWDMKEIAQSVVTIFPLTDEEKQHLLGMDNAGEGKLDSVTKRTAIIEYLMNLAESKYEEMIVKKANQPELVLEIEKQILLRSIDTLWIDHLVAIDYLRTGIGLRGYGQRDPLVEYKKETYQMFNELLNAIQKEVVYSIYKVSIGIELAPSLMEKANVNYQGAQKTSSSGELSLSVPTSTTTDGKEVGRNDPCWCGSGKKFKKCHGA
jgi:preprotein translocase subunit SecA